VLGVVRHWPTKDHEAVGFFQEGILLLLSVVLQGSGFFFSFFCLEPLNRNFS
jgi:hypothetical protein